jgi:(p)ppGpp synthase/HD superfamily hydrolase
MKLSLKIKQAIDTAAQLHQNQVRKGRQFPYVSHPYAVAFIVENYTDDEDIVVAALLHDVLEDVSRAVYDESRMRREFGDRVTDLVKEVSEDKSLHNWLDRKQAYYEHLKTASQGALLISAADLTHNLACMLADYQIKGTELWNSFNAPITKKLKIDAARIAIIKERLDSDVNNDLEAAYYAFEQAIKKSR